MTATGTRPCPGNPLIAPAQGAQRDAVISGLHDLADWLTANPAVEVRQWGYELLFAPSGGIAGVQRHAALSGVPVDDRGHACRAVKRFGPVSYTAYAAKGAEPS